MTYRFTCLTPVLVGDGRKLSPIDYMVWKDHVNVLDQRRIFRLLAKGPRLDNYLSQLKRADRLDFASWGGFAQNFAGRRIPFEHASCSQSWERARTENLHIPTFACGPDGPYLPGTSIKGALRTAVVFRNLGKDALARLTSQTQPERLAKRPGALVEEKVLGEGGGNRMRAIQVSDSLPASVSNFKVYLLRVASLRARAKEGFLLGWKQTPSGTADGSRPEESAPCFAEMAAPGSVFEGRWQEPSFLGRPEIQQALRWKPGPARAGILEAANLYSQALLEAHSRYAELAGLSLVKEDLARLKARLGQVMEAGNGCLLPLGWGGGLLARVAWLETDDPGYRQIIAQCKMYGRGPVPGFPFPKTRRIVFLNGRPSCLPGWGLLELEG